MDPKFFRDNLVLGRENNKVFHKNLKIKILVFLIKILLFLNLALID
jgi:hypothetical protein